MDTTGQGTQGCGGCSLCVPGGWSCNDGNGCGVNGVCDCPSSSSTTSEGAQISLLQMFRVLSAKKQIALTASSMKGSEKPAGQCKCSKGYTGVGCASCEIGFWSSGGACAKCKGGGDGGCDETTGACASSGSPSPMGPKPTPDPKPTPEPVTPATEGKKCLVGICLTIREWKITLGCVAGVAFMLIVVACVGCYARCHRRRRQQIKSGMPVTRQSLLTPLTSVVNLGNKQDVLVYSPPAPFNEGSRGVREEEVVEEMEEHVVQVLESRKSSSSYSSTSSGVSYPPPAVVPMPPIGIRTPGGSVSFNYRYTTESK